MQTQSYYIEVRELETDKVVKRMGPHNERRAERIDDGLNHNLNHDKYYTVIVTNETGEFSDGPIET